MVRALRGLPAAIGLAAGLLWATPLLAGQAASAVSEHVFSVGLSRIAETYLKPVDLAQLTVNGLNGLHSLDPAVSVQREGSRFSLRSHGAVIAEFSAPASLDATGLASLASRIVERARALSPTLRQASAEEIYAAVFDRIMGDLDGYSRYTGANKAVNERAQREGYGGIGIELEERKARPVVVEVVPHSPASRAGIRVGDAILSVDGERADRMPLRDLSERLRGPSGSSIAVSFASDGGQPRRVSLRRERVIHNAVQLTVDGTVAVLKLERFNAATALNLREAVESARAQIGPRMQGLVLDLRGNPGGLLDQAVAVADLFIPAGRIISTIGRHPDSVQRFEATSDDIAAGLPMVVLLDGRTASASEIVAAALQDSGRAVVVGASSFGKGSVQTVTRLPNDGELLLTWSRIYAPSGYTLHRQGVTPTICTSREQRDAAQVIGELRAGQQAPPSLLAHWRAAAADDDTALARLRETCPWKSHEAELDVQVAKRLLMDGPLYQRAVRMSMPMVAER
ncbi:S41 family peptidase [Arenibaculum pallidiluteum]|uniref:S41 family peptidase n=1 Tax=Arenibaculum pallidiluteum TaxID=2812559 RepID=UPI001A97A361|nr:S41 family peptidase [Arenibaculum pallidiluteum]